MKEGPAAPCSECGYETPMSVAENRQDLPGREEGDCGYWLTLATSKTPPSLVRRLPVSDSLAIRLSEIDQGIVHRCDDGMIAIELTLTPTLTETTRFANIPTPVADDLLTEADPHTNIVEVFDSFLPQHLPVRLGLTIQPID